MHPACMDACIWLRVEAVMLWSVCNGLDQRVNDQEQGLCVRHWTGLPVGSGASGMRIVAVLRITSFSDPAEREVRGPKGSL